MIGLILIAAVCLYLGKNFCSLLSRFNKSVALLLDYPGLRLVIYPHCVFAMLPRLPWINLGDQYTWRYKHDLFASRGSSDVLSLVSLFPPSRAILVADPVSIKHITGDRARYIKPIHMYRALSQFGMNVGVAEGIVWRRHRKIVGGSFSEKTNRLSWEESSRTVNDCLNEWSTCSTKNKEGKREILVENAVELTLKIALFVICAAAFSLRPPWRDDVEDAIPKGHHLPFRVAMHGVLEGAMIKVMTPNFAYRLPISRLHHVKECYDEFESYLNAMITERQAHATTNLDIRESNDGEGRRDLLGALVYASAEIEDDAANLAESGDAKERGRLNSVEVMGNMYIFLLAGHETTAHTLAFTFALLALYPQEQEKLLAQIDEVFTDGVEPSYEDYAKLTLSYAVFLETLRLYPSVIVIPKLASIDTSFPTASNDDGTPNENVFVPKWTEVLLDVVALQRNPKYWGSDANEFKPERFIDLVDQTDESKNHKWPRDAFLGFSGGHRSCMGQKFAMIEAVCVISLLLRKYSVHLHKDVDDSTAGVELRRKRAVETFEQKVERVMKCKSLITLSPGKTSLIFRER